MLDSPHESTLSATQLDFIAPRAPSDPFIKRKPVMYKILEKQVLSDVTKLMVVEAPQVALKAKAGQFIIVLMDDHSERIPLTIADYDRAAGSITLIFQEVGKSSIQMGTMNVGDSFKGIVGPLGHPTEIENYGEVICIGGGVGIAPVYPIARELKEAGNRVISIIGRKDQGPSALGGQDALLSPTNSSSRPTTARMVEKTW